MAKYADIPLLTKSPSYCINIDLAYLPFHVTRQVLQYGLDLDPPFQRSHVWTVQQQISYMENLLRRGIVNNTILLNCIGWWGGSRDNYVLVDGKQRLNAMLAYLNNEFPIFGNSYCSDFTDHHRGWAGVQWAVNDLATYPEVLRWYLEVNTGGTVHTEKEIAHVEELLRTGATYPILSKHELIDRAALLKRKIFQLAIEETEREEATNRPSTPNKEGRRKNARNVSKTRG